MSVNDREPNIPKDDTGKGLRVLGVMFIAWTAFSLVWMPARVRSTSLAGFAVTLCFIVGVVLVGTGYLVSWLGPPEERRIEETHDLMEKTHGGSQIDGPLFANENGPGRAPTRVA